MKIVANLAQIQSQINDIERQYQRPKGSVRLLAVSKTRSVDEIRAAIGAGQRHFGENYCQEAIEKIKVLKNPELTWHFIGPIQSNKSRQIATNFDWVHTVDRIKIARRLNEARLESSHALKICVQINISEEQSKSGISINEARDFIKELDGFSNLCVRGLMALPAPASLIEEQRKPFAKLRECFEQLRQNRPELDTLSIGTTQDMEAAIAEGATIVRIGTAIFGPRNA